MKRIAFIIAGFLIALFFFQAYELYHRYEEENHKLKRDLEESFHIAIKLELSGRMHSGTAADPKNPKFVIRSADEMTLEERANLRGDTITLKDVKERNLKNNFVDLFTQRFQDGLLNANKPLRLTTLDSLFTDQLNKKGLLVTTRVTLLDSIHKVIETAGILSPNTSHQYLTEIQPIGTSGLRYVQGFAKLSPLLPFRYMFYAIVLSAFVMGIAIWTLCYLLKKIKEAHKQLREREIAVHCAIHDLKSPLNMAYSTIDLITLTEKNPERISLLAEGKFHIKSLTEIIESMLSLLKRPDGKTRTEQKTVDPTTLIKQAFQTVASLYPNKKYFFRLEKESDFPTQINTEPIQLERCLRNLIENALKYSDDNVKITVWLKVENNHWSIGLEDTGWGIPKKAQKQLGKQFFRVKREGKPYHSGYGLGLSSVFLLTREMGGSLQFRSEEGKGSLFLIKLPKMINMKQL